jgi:hypothetical protein
LLPPSFSARFLLLSNSLTTPRLNLSSIKSESALSKIDQVEEVLRQLNCSRICRSQGILVREEGKNTKIACAFGFRESRPPSNPENPSLVHVLTYRVRIFVITCVWLQHGSLFSYRFGAGYAASRS